MKAIPSPNSVKRIVIGHGLPIPLMAREQFGPQQNGQENREESENKRDPACDETAMRLAGADAVDSERNRDNHQEKAEVRTENEEQHVPIYGHSGSPRRRVGADPRAGHRFTPELQCS